VIGARGGRLACAAAVCVLSLGGSEGEARAAALSVRLEYAAAPGCPDATELEAVVSARLGFDPFADDAPNLVLVRITPRADAAGALDGHIEWRDARGHWAGEQAFPRVGTDCLRLARTMAFALAVQIQLLARSGEANAGGGPAADERRPAPALVDTPPAEPPRRPPPAPAPFPIGDREAPPERAPGPVFAVGAGPALGFGVSSAVVPLGRVFGSLAWPRGSLELAAEVGVPATTRRADGAGFSQQRLVASAAACAARARWNACVVANAGAIRMAGEDIDRATSAVVPVVEAGGRVAVVQPLGRRAFLSAHADGLVRLVRWTGSLDHVPVWTAPRFGAALGLDAGIRFP
jgi:hypothetical protein